MKTDVQPKQNVPLCVYCHSYMDRKEPERLTLQQVHEASVRDEVCTGICYI
jgi:hypothetical protein